jgi:uncharacterized protein with PQ loop repeat
MHFLGSTAAVTLYFMYVPQFFAFYKQNTLYVRTIVFTFYKPCMKIFTLLAVRKIYVSPNAPL